MKNKDNFFVATKATWKGVKAPKRTPDYISNSGSEYWYTPQGVYRKSDHWSHIYINNKYWYGCTRVATCYWTLKLKYRVDSYDLCGFTSWDHFRDNVVLMGV